MPPATYRRAGGGHSSNRPIARRGARLLRRTSGKGAAASAPSFSPLSLTPALWIDPSDAATVTISGSSGAYIGANGLVLPGSGANYATTPLGAHNTITNSLDVIVKATATSWADATYRYLASARSGLAGWGFWIDTAGSGKLGFSISSIADYTSTVGTGFSAGTTNWVRVTRDHVSGDVTFYTSSDGSSWTQLGTTVAGSTVGMGTPTGTALNVGYAQSTLPFAGSIQRCIVKSGIAGTTVFDADFDAATPFVSAFTESALGAPVYVVSSTATSSTASYGYVGPTGLVLSGSGAGYATAPDIAAYTVTDEFEVLIKAQAVDWTPAAIQTLLSTKAAGVTAGFKVTLNTNGTLMFSAATGAANQDTTSSAAVPFTDGSTGYIKITNKTGVGVTFYTSTDGSSYSQLGTVGATIGAGWDAATGPYVGIRTDGQFPFMGTIMRVAFGTTIGGAYAFDANFAGAADYCTSFTESSSNAATVTITATNTPANAAGACVSQINDKSGNARHLTQGTLANMPKYWNGVAGSNILVFDGTSDNLVRAGAIVSQPDTVFLVARHVALVANEHFLDSSVTTTRQMVSGSPNWQIYAYNLVPLDSGVPGDTAWHQLTALFNGASSKLRKDGTQIASGTAGAGALADILVGSGNGGQYTSCWIGEFFITPADDSANTSAESYMKAKWSTP